MRKHIAQVVASVVLAVVVIAVVFIAGMRAKARPVLNAVRRLGRATKPLVLRSAGTPGASASVIRHVGRISGREYETPIVAVSTGDGFVIALPYGPNTDWLKNVLACGSATIVHEGTTHRVDQPEIDALMAADRFFPSKEQRTHRLFGVTQCLRVRCTQLDDQTADFA